MIILITGASHVGKTVLAQHLLEKYHFPYLSIDHLKMGLIRSGNTNLTPEDDDELTAYLWPIVREMIKTAIENVQNLIVEGCYVPFDWRKDFTEEYASQIRFVCLAMSDAYIDAHFSDIAAHGSDVECRGEDADCTAEWLKDGNRAMIEGFRKAGEQVTVIEENYEEVLAKVEDRYLEMRTNPSEYRKVFDTIPEQFDKFRPRYSADLFEYLIKTAGIGPESKVLEIGPGTGQATDPILNTGCDYNAIELGEHLYAKMIEKYGSRPNFHIVNDDFITHDFGEQKFDMIYSAATIQWIPERVAFPKTLELLKPGGTLAMMFLIGDYKTPNEELYNNIQKVYSEYFKPVTDYKNMKEPFDYRHATDYGYVDLTRHDFYGKRTFTAEEYVMYCGTHSDHILVPEPYKSKFFEGLRNTVLEAGDKIEFQDTYVLYLAKKPMF